MKAWGSPGLIVIPKIILQSYLPTIVLMLKNAQFIIYKKFIKLAFTVILKLCMIDKQMHIIYTINKLTREG